MNLVTSEFPFELIPFFNCSEGTSNPPGMSSGSTPSEFSHKEATK